MTLPRVQRTGSGFTLVEALVVSAIIGVLAALILPALAKAPGRARQIKCLNNLHQVALGFNLFAADHDGRFPMRVPAAEGGSRDYINTMQSFRHFQVLSNQLDQLRVLVCPSDTRQPALNWSTMRNLNLSYFVALGASSSNATGVLAGDRNISRIPGVGAGGAVINATASWGTNLHQFRGNLVLADGSTHRTTDEQLREFLTSAARVSQ